MDAYRRVIKCDITNTRLDFGRIPELNVALLIQPEVNPKSARSQPEVNPKSTRSQYEVHVHGEFTARDTLKNCSLIFCVQTMKCNANDTNGCATKTRVKNISAMPICNHARTRKSFAFRRFYHDSPDDATDANSKFISTTAIPTEHTRYQEAARWYVDRFGAPLATTPPK